jgi:hypothetical protein
MVIAYDVMIQEITETAREYNIILDQSQGLTMLTPGVIMFFGVALNCELSHGRGRQRKYLALFDQGYYSIEPYENQTFI